MSRDANISIEALRSFRDSINRLNILEKGKSLSSNADKIFAKQVIANIAASIIRLCQFPDSKVIRAINIDSILRGVKDYFSSIPTESRSALNDAINMVESAVGHYKFVLSPLGDRVLLSECDPDELGAIQELTDDVTQEDIFLLRVKNILQQPILPESKSPIKTSNHPSYDKYGGMHPLDKVLVDSGVEFEEDLRKFRVLPLGDEDTSQQEDPRWLAAAIDVIEGVKKRNQVLKMTSAKISDHESMELTKENEYDVINRELSERVEKMAKLGKKLLELSGYDYEG